MIAEAIAQETALSLYSTVLDSQKKGKNGREISIEPWNNDAQLPFKAHLSIQNGRLQTPENRNSQRKTTVDQKIVKMYRKYSNEATLADNAKANLINSRHIYREKLKEFQNGPEFKRMGGKKEPQNQEIVIALPKESEELSFRRPNLYCCDYKEFRFYKGQEWKNKSEYKYNHKFQRMLKIKDKIRKKNSLTVSKQKEKYQSEYQSQTIHQQKQPTYAAVAKATIQRNKLKLKMRGFSKEDIRGKKDFSWQVNNTASFSIQSKNVPIKSSREGLSFIYEKWRCLEGEGLPQRMSKTLTYFKQ